VANLKLFETLRNRMTPALLLALAAVASTAQAEVVVIVSAKSHVKQLTADQTAKIFLGKAGSFPDDGDAVPVDQAEGSAVRDEFYSKVVRKSPSQLSAYWAKVIFTGDGHPPEILESNTAVKKAVAKNPNAIGYIDKSAVDKSVRVILKP
jgi:ABC-type phosphate transport system substrate-binding protein